MDDKPKRRPMVCQQIDESQIKEAGAALASAFTGDPVTDYLLEHLVQDRDQYSAASQAFHEWIVRAGFAKNRSVYFTAPAPNGPGTDASAPIPTETPSSEVPVPAVAVWFAPGDKISDWDWLRAGMLGMLWKTGWRSASRIMETQRFDIIKKKHLGDRPFYYLLAIGVRAGEQGKGLSSVLLRELTARADRDSVACWLESSKIENVKIYEHFGFKAVENTTIGSNVTVICMLREPEASSRL